ncbi:unnamed protein product [Cuscuta europaea]|uniref:Uncharacterized protein n=1 Tax=Cuscuta europaea TaxID=41803 RepID=A0A9P1EHE4_CUSEU|nr:unnamed protein product [Cuscuta europaea]
MQVHNANASINESVPSDNGLEVEDEHEKHEVVTHVAEEGHQAHVEHVDMHEAASDVGQQSQIGYRATCIISNIMHEVDNANASDINDFVPSDTAYWDEVVEW